MESFFISEVFGQAKGAFAGAFENKGILEFGNVNIYKSKIYFFLIDDSKGGWGVI